MVKRGRPSSAALSMTGASPRPKSAKADPVGYRVARIQSVLKMSEEPPVSGMLCDVCDLSFKHDSEHRHPYESGVIEMIKTAIIGMRANADAERMDAETVKHQAMTENEDFINRLEDLRKQRDNKQLEIRAAMEWEKKKDAELKVADANKKKFLKESKAFYATVERAKKAVDEAGASYEQVCELRDHVDKYSEKDRKKFLQFLNPLMKKMNVDDALMNAAPIAFLKNAGARGAFDKAAIQEVENDYNKYFAEIKKIEQGYQPQVAANEAEEAELERKHKQAEEVLVDAKEKVQILDGEQTELTNAISDIASKSQDAIQALKLADNTYNAAVSKVQLIDESLKYIDELSQRIGDSLDAAQELM